MAREATFLKCQKSWGTALQEIRHLVLIVTASALPMGRPIGTLLDPLSFGDLVFWNLK